MQTEIVTQGSSRYTQASKTRDSVREAKDRLREMVERGYYPTVQVSGPPMVTISESIDDA